MSLTCDICGASITAGAAIWLVRPTDTDDYVIPERRCCGYRCKESATDTFWETGVRYAVHAGKEPVALSEAQR